MDFQCLTYQVLLKPANRQCIVITVILQPAVKAQAY